MTEGSCSRNTSDRPMPRHPGLIFPTLLILVTVFLLAGCHQLTNPADPNSPAYGGVPITDGPFIPDKDEILPKLPEIVQWRSYAQHLPNQWIWQEITEDGLFVESRESGVFPDQLLVGLVFAEEVDFKVRQMSLAIIGINSQGDPSNPPIMELIGLDQIEGDINGFILLYRYPGAADPNGSRIRIRVLHPSGSVASERTFAWLQGDVDGNGYVQTAGPERDNVIVDSWNGWVADPARLNTVRADINTNGLVEGTGGPITDDVDLVILRTGFDLYTAPIDVPEF